MRVVGGDASASIDDVVRGDCGLWREVLQQRDDVGTTEQGLGVALGGTFLSMNSMAGMTKAI
jgi:hypothetical protein